MLEESRYAGEALLGSRLDCLQSCEENRYFASLHDCKRKKGPSLLQTLQRVADGTPSVLYTGDLAAQLAFDVRNAGGIMTAADLASYSPRIREPLRTMEMGEASLQTASVLKLEFDYFS
jgi:gamma-glutamyltranspeptidase